MCMLAGVVCLFAFLSLNVGILCMCAVEFKTRTLYILVKYRPAKLHAPSWISLLEMLEKPW